MAGSADVTAGSDAERATAGDARVVVTADDLGLTEGVNRGIFEAVRAGTVSAVSLMVGTPGWGDARARIRDEGARLSVGLHLNLTVGEPLTSARSLRDRTGRFLGLGALTWHALAGGIDPVDVRDETAAQLEAVGEAGGAPTHVDAHRHAHLLPGVASGVREAVERAGVRFLRAPLEPIGEAWRRPGTALKQTALRAAASVSGAKGRGAVAFRGMSLLDARDVAATLAGILDRLPSGVTEIAVHPGYVTAELAPLDPYLHGRERELAALVQPELAERMRRGPFRLVGFADL